MDRVRYWVSLDCGQSHDYSAAMVSQRVGEEIHVTSLSRAPLRTPYPTIAKAVLKKCCELEPVGAFGERRPVGLVVDAGGVGRAVADLIRQEIRSLPRSKSPKIRFLPVTATGGSHTRIGAGSINVPKKDLVSAAVVAMQQGILRIGDVENAGLLKAELQEYRSKLTKRGYETFEGAGRNDDLVYALALACWSWSHTRQIQPEGRQERRRRPLRRLGDLEPTRFGF